MTQEALASKLDLEEAHRQLLKVDQQKTLFPEYLPMNFARRSRLYWDHLRSSFVAMVITSNIQTAVKNGQRLLRLVNQLLDFQKIQAGRKTYDFTTVELGQFIRNCQNYV